MRILLLTPPMTQLNTPYPATAYLTGFLRAVRPDLQVFQSDPAIELVLRLFSKKGLQKISLELSGRALLTRGEPPASIGHFLHFATRYADVVEPVIRFLQGKDPSLAIRIASREYLPEGPRFQSLRDQVGGGDT